VDARAIGARTTIRPYVVKRVSPPQGNTREWEPAPTPHPVLGGGVRVSVLRVD